MRLVDVLSELGGSMPEVMKTLLACDEAASALECVRQSACAGIVSSLAGAPSAMLHESQMPTTNLLYAAEGPCLLDDAAYMQDTDATFCAPIDACCIGGLTMQVTQELSRPALLYLASNNGALELAIHVYDAPLAAMENELFDGVGGPSAFERQWMGEEALFAAKLRAEVGTHIRGQGFDKMPGFLHSGEVALQRPGVLPLLRLRTASTEAERDELRAALERERCPVRGCAKLNDLLVAEEPRSPGPKTTATTVFHQRRQDERPEPDEGASCIECMEFSLLGSLGLIVLKYMEDFDYLGVVPLGEDDALYEEGQSSSTLPTAKQASVVETILAAELESTPVKKVSALACRSERIFTRLAAHTRRACDSKLVINTHNARDAAQAVARITFGPLDVLILNNMLVQSPSMSLVEQLAFMAARGQKRHAFLVMVKETDGQLRSCVLQSQKGEWEVPIDSVSRYLLFPWVIPLVIDGPVVSIIKVHDVARELFQVNAVVKAEQAPDANMVQPTMQMAASLEGMAKELQALTSLSAINTRLDSIEALLQRPTTAAGAGAPALPAPPALPRQPRPLAAAVVSALSSQSPPTDVQRGLKRVIENLLLYDVQQTVKRGETSLSR